MQREALSQSLDQTLMDVLCAGQSVTLHVASSSMMPLLQPGDALTIEPCRADQAVWGQIVVCRTGGEWVAHGLCYRSKRTVITCGATADRFDTPWEPRHVIGRVVGAMRGSEPLNLSTPAALWRSRRRLIWRILLILARKGWRIGKALRPGEKRARG